MVSIELSLINLERALAASRVIGYQRLEAATLDSLGEAYLHVEEYDLAREQFTDAVIRGVSEKKETVVFVLWGGYAQKKLELVDTSRHAIVSSAHPSPLSARRGFFGSRPFSKINAALRDAGRGEIDWRLPSTP